MYIYCISQMWQLLILTLEVKRRKEKYNKTICVTTYFDEAMVDKINS